MCSTRLRHLNGSQKSGHHYSALSTNGGPDPPAQPQDHGRHYDAVTRGTAIVGEPQIQHVAPERAGLKPNVRMHSMVDYTVSGAGSSATAGLLVHDDEDSGVRDLADPSEVQYTNGCCLPPFSFSLYLRPNPDS